MNKVYTTDDQKNLSRTSLIVVGTALLAILVVPFMAQAQATTTFGSVPLATTTSGNTSPSTTTSGNSGGALPSTMNSGNSSASTTTTGNTTTASGISTSGNWNTSASMTTYGNSNASTRGRDTSLSMTTSASAAFYRQMDLGMRGADVSALQTYLAADASIYPEGLVTGYYGPLTAAAVGRYQAKNGLANVGRVGPMTLAMLGGAGSGGSVSSGSISGWGTGGSDDMSAPNLSGETVRTSANSATFTWNTDEPAYASVAYGSTWPFSYASAPVMRATGGPSVYQTVTVTNLYPNMTYYYVLMSTDQSGNMNQTTGKSFTTSN